MRTPKQCPDSPTSRLIPTSIDPATQQAAWSRIENILTANFHNPDLEAAKVFFACVAAHRIIERPAAWLLMIAPPGSMKTVLLESLDGMATIHFVDEVTPNTFISGKLKDPGKVKLAPASLLHRIGTEGILVNADFSTTLSMDRHKKAAVLSQLRRIYDGFFRREFGSDENLDEREWKGRLTFLAGVTPDVDSYHGLFQSLGERFLRIRWGRAGGIESALFAMEQQDGLKDQLREAVHDFLHPVFDQAFIDSPKISRDFLEYLAEIGEETVKARAYIKRNSRTREIEDEPQIESNTRLPQQLAQVVRGWTVLMGQREDDGDGIVLAKRAAEDSIPSARLKVLNALRFEEDPYKLGLPRRVVDRAKEELQLVGLVNAP